VIPDPLIPPEELAAPPERADAARNRRRVLDAAAALFAERGVAAVTVDDVAAAAGVGRMTLYRRFGDKGGLARALLGEQERDLQQQVLTGSPPLGPGAPPAERLAAFVAAYLRFCDAHLDLVRLSEHADPAERYRRGVYRLWHIHCRLLLEAAGAPDPDHRADLVLAGLLGDLVAHRRRERHDALDDLVTATCRAARALSTP
jgi:AcrR family transcriptional regulator